MNEKDELNLAHEKFIKSSLTEDGIFSIFAKKNYFSQ